MEIKKATDGNGEWCAEYVEWGGTRTVSTKGDRSHHAIEEKGG